MFFLVNKPIGISSFFAASMVRKAIGAKKVGHTGTLDPLATGLLIIATEGSTKLIPFLENDTKTYEFEVDFSRTSESLDLGTPTTSMDIEDCNRAQKILTPQTIEAILPEFTGKIQQIPPKYSAIKIDGKRAYNLARREYLVDMPERLVEIFSLRLLSFRFPIARLSAEVSAGTYIRSLARDLGTRLWMFGVIVSLRRTAVGKWSVKDATEHPRDVRRELALSPFDLLPNFWKYIASPEEVGILLQGNPLECREEFLEWKNILVSDGFDLISLCKTQNGQLIPLRNRIGG